MTGIIDMTDAFLGLNCRDPDKDYNQDYQHDQGANDAFPICVRNSQSSLHFVIK